VSEQKQTSMCVTLLTYSHSAHM